MSVRWPRMGVRETLTCDTNSLPWPVVLSRRDVFDLANSQHAVDHLAKYDVLAVEEVASCAGDEELTPVGVRTGVSHAQQAWSCVLLLEVFVCELVSINAEAPAAVSVEEIS